MIYHVKRMCAALWDTVWDFYGRWIGREIGDGSFYVGDYVVDKTIML